MADKVEPDAGPCEHHPVGRANGQSRRDGNRGPDRPNTVDIDAIRMRERLNRRGTDADNQEETSADLAKLHRSQDSTDTFARRATNRARWPGLYVTRRWCFTDEHGDLVSEPARCESAHRRAHLDDQVVEVVDPDEPEAGYSKSRMT